MEYINNISILEYLKEYPSLSYCSLDQLKQIISHFNKYEIQPDEQPCSEYLEVYTRWCEKEQQLIALKKREENKRHGYAMRAENIKENKKFKCVACDLYTNNKKLYDDHLLTRDHFIAIDDQDSIAKLFCKACGKNDFKSLTEVYKHENKRECAELRTCPICKKVCSRKQTYEDHFNECKNKMIELEKQLQAFKSLNI